MLTLEPLVDALAAGNTAIVKPSAYSANTSDLISRMLGDVLMKNMWQLLQAGGKKIHVC